MSDKKKKKKSKTKGETNRLITAAEKNNNKGAGQTVSAGW